MKNIQKIRKTAYLLAAIFLIAGMLPFGAFVNVSPVFADSDEQPAVAVPTPDEKDVSVTQAMESSENLEEPDNQPEADVPGDETQTDDPNGAVEPEIEAQLPDEDIEDLDESTDIENPKPESSTDKNKEEVEVIIEYLNDEEISLVNSAGGAIPLASQEAAEMLGGSDPFFWDGTQWIGYTTSGTGCPANVICQQSDTPFQTAVSAAPAGTTIYIAQGHYDEDVAINTPDLSFVGFSNIDVPLTFETLTPTFSGYASVRSITLAADFGTTSGVYANSVFVNAGGKLNDGLSLVNTGGTVEANVVLKSAGSGNYQIHDANDNSTSFVWECVEPKENIYPGRNYRMVFKDPQHPDILNYFASHGENPLNLNPEQRVANLILGVNLANQGIPSAWSAQDEERVFWHLLGHTKDINGNPIPLTSKQQGLYNDIVNGNYQFGDNLEKEYGIWFLWPTIENNTIVSPDTRQLTIIAYDEPRIVGCTDPGMFNYDPNANVSGDCVAACQWDPSLPANSPNCHGPSKPGGGGGAGGTGGVVGALIPVTADPIAEEELMLLPVTGLDQPTKTNTLQSTLVNLGLLLFGSALALEGISRRKQTV